MEQKPNLNIDLTNPEILQKAAEANVFNSATGKHIVTIKQAYVTYTNNGAAALNLAFETDDKKTWKLNPLYIKSGKDKNYAETKNFYVLASICALTGSSGQIGPTTITITEWNNGQKIETKQEVEGYNDLIGKKIGIVMVVRQLFQEKLPINGYTGLPIVGRLADPEEYERQKASPETIWMPDYAQARKPDFQVVQYFDHKTGRTLSEIQHDVQTPKIVNNTLKKISHYNLRPEPLSVTEWNKLRKKKLISRLKYYGEEFDESKFIESTSIPNLNTEDIITNDNDIEYDDINYDDIL